MIAFVGAFLAFCFQANKLTTRLFVGLAIFVVSVAIVGCLFANTNGIGSIGTWFGGVQYEYDAEKKRWKPRRESVLALWKGCREFGPNLAASLRSALRIRIEENAAEGNSATDYGDHHELAQVC